MEGTWPHLEVLAPERHAHAARAATATRELGGRDLEKLEPRFVEYLVGDVVALIDADLARCHGEGVGTIVPLLAGSCRGVTAAAEDEPDPVEAERLGEHVLEGVDQLDDVDLSPFGTLGELEYLQGAQDGGMDGELVHAMRGC